MKTGVHLQRPRGGSVEGSVCRRLTVGDVGGIMLRECTQKATSEFVVVVVSEIRVVVGKNKFFHDANRGKRNRKEFA